MKMTSNPILLLLLIGLLFYTVLFFALSHARAADCNDKAVLCTSTPGVAKISVFGWQSATKQKSKIWPHPKFCKRTGPAQCPRRPNLSDMPQKIKLDTDIEGVCRAAVVADFRGRGEYDHCSTGIFGAAFPLAGLVFGKSACMEHDICYSMPGTERKTCDRMFNTNLKAACKQYFYKHNQGRNGVNFLNHPGYAACLAAAKVGHTGVLAVGDAFFGANNYPACGTNIPTPLK